MAVKRKITLRCPICKKAVANSGGDFPFCGERCRLIDLGKWASGQYVIPSPLDDAAEELSHQAETIEGGVRDSRILSRDADRDNDT